MRSSIMKLLLSFVLSVAVWSCAMANKATIEDVKEKVPENDYISSFELSLENNLVDVEFDVKTASEGPIEMKANVYQDQRLIQTVTNTYKKPVDEIAQQNVCQATESPEPDDESYSLATGKHELKGCDVASYYSGMDPGNYEVEVAFLKDNAELTSFTMQVKVEEE